MGGGPQSGKVVLEFEQREAAHKAVANAVYTASSSSADPNAGELADTKKELAKLKAEVKAAAKAAANQTYATAKGKGKGGDAEKKICFHFRDHGNCPKGDSCPVALTLTTKSFTFFWPPALLFFLRSLGATGTVLPY